MSEQSRQTEPNDPLPFDAVQTPSPLGFDQPQSKYSFVRMIQLVASFGVGIIALLIGTGALTVNLVMKRFTDIVVYNIDTGSYIQYGAGVILIGTLSISLLVWLIYLPPFTALRTKYIDNFLYSGTLLIRAIRRLGLAVLLIAFSVALSALLIIFLWDLNKPYLVIALKDNVTPALLGLPSNPANSHWTGKVERLITLEDGLLVRAEDGTVVAIKNDVIAAILDDEKRTAPSPVVTPSPAASSAPTPTSP